MNKKQKLPQNNQEQFKNKIDIICFKLWQQIADVRIQLEMLQLQRLTSADPTLVEKEWYHKQIAVLRGFNQDVDRLLTKNQKTILKGLKSDTKAIQIGSIKDQRELIIKSFDQMKRQTIRNYQQSIADIRIQSESGKPLEKLIADRITHQSPLFVEMDDGRKWKTENYLEMRVRTDFSNEVSSNMIAVGQQYGVIFYIASSFGDCAKDHQVSDDGRQLDGAIFYDAEWDRSVDVGGQIQQYIDDHKLMSIQDAVGSVGNYFTTRPNCRHYFEYIDVESVLEIKTEKDLNKEREDRGINWQGKYDPQKYEASQIQRANERAIRDRKENISKLEAIQKTTSDQTQKDILQNKIDQQKRSLNDYRYKQRELLNNGNVIEKKIVTDDQGNKVLKWVKTDHLNVNDLERDPKREKSGNPSDFRVKK